jgi:hypothetical protein
MISDWYFYNVNHSDRDQELVTGRLIIAWDGTFLQPKAQKMGTTQTTSDIIGKSPLQVLHGYPFQPGQDKKSHPESCLESLLQQIQKRMAQLGKFSSSKIFLQPHTLYCIMCIRLRI